MNIQESPMEDNESVHSDDSNSSVSMTKLEDLINMELKHSSVHYDLQSKDNLLKVDLENLYNSCNRFECQIKKKNELLEQYHKKLMECQKRNKIELKERLLSIIQKLEEINSLFYRDFHDYSSEVLQNSINIFDKEIDKSERNLLEIEKELNNFQLKGNITESLMKSKQTQISNIENLINMLIEFSMRRPEIEIEETATKLDNEIKKLEEKRQELKFVGKK